MFDKYLCRKIGKKEISIRDVLGKIVGIIPNNDFTYMVIAVSLYLECCYIILNYNMLIHQLFDIESLKSILIALVFDLSLLAIWVKFNISDKVIAVCPMKLKR